MAIIDKNGTYMALPSAIKRGNPVALDTTAVWYTKAEMEEYAANGATAYVGQILTLVDSENNNLVTAYIIKDEAGTLDEVGSATLGDNKTITLDENAGTLSLKNWGIEYYKWIEPVGEEGDENYVAGHHEKQVVDANNPWIAGLEPKATTATDGTIEIAWYQPSTVTIQGVSSAITSVQTTVNELTAGIGSAEDEAGADTVYGAINEVKASNETLSEQVAGKVDSTGGTLTGDLVLADGSKAASEAVVDSKIAEAIQSAGHLKREIVETLPAVEEADDETIYMVPDNQDGDEDVYNEYMLINGDYEKIGDTYVDLSNYIQKVTGAVEGNFAALDATGALVDAELSTQEVKEHLENEERHITADERTAWNDAAALAQTNAEAIAAMPTISADDAEKLANLPVITTIGDNLTLENGVLAAVAEQYELPVASDSVLGGVKIGTGLAIENEVVSVKIDEANANGLSIGTDGLTLAIATTTAAGAMSAEQALKLENLPANAEANIIDGALLGANEIAAVINDNKKLVLPFASADMPGLVVSSTNADAVAVHATTGEMTVNSLSTSKLYVPENEEFVLNGGTSLI